MPVNDQYLETHWPLRLVVFKVNAICWSLQLFPLSIQYQLQSAPHSPLLLEKHLRHQNPLAPDQFFRVTIYS